jgi:hypothetical protein
MSQSEGRTSEPARANTKTTQEANRVVKSDVAQTYDLSRPLIELIGIPGPEQLRTIARILGLVDAVEQRPERERKTAGEAA